MFWGCSFTLKDYFVTNTPQKNKCTSDEVKVIGTIDGFHPLHHDEPTTKLNFTVIWEQLLNVGSSQAWHKTELSCLTCSNQTASGFDQTFIHCNKWNELINTVFNNMKSGELYVIASLDCVPFSWMKWARFCVITAEQWALRERSIMKSTLLVTVALQRCLKTSKCCPWPPAPTPLLA